MEKLSVIFFGTHQFATSILQALLEDKSLDVGQVVTQPDKPVGRKQELKASPVKEFALLRHVPVLEPESLKQFNTGSEPYDLFVVAQYGKLIPASVLEIPKYGTINVHTSLLPKYRGASPIQSAILHGETSTGVTIMLMDEGLDTGPILAQEVIVIGEQDTTPDVEATLSVVSSRLLLKIIPEYVSGAVKPRKQIDADATFCKKITKEDGQIDWSTTTSAIYNTYRAYHPWPGVWTKINGKRLKLIRLLPHTDMNLAYGTITYNNDKIYVGTRDGSVELIELQLEGKNKMTAAEFIHGYASFKDTVLESPDSFEIK